MRGGHDVGLFDRLTKPKSGGKQDLSEYAGMRIEVMNEDGEILFVGRADVTAGGMLELQPITVPRVSPDVKYVSVLMRGYEDSVKKAVHMEGGVSPRSNGRWLVEDITITGKDNDRAFFRQDTVIGGEVMPFKQAGVESQPCKLQNISAGGVCILVDAEYQLGDRLLLRSNLLEGWELTPLICVVRRITKRKGGYEYGCEFADLTPATEDLIVKAIMEMQLKRRRME